ncbi:hypothetical protein CBS101457_005067 [Exobasidium rhododendri]|nr:hypothetical protein CBS101457_005067 [Exobasidium rhododendri]
MSSQNIAVIRGAGLVGSAVVLALGHEKSFCVRLLGQPDPQSSVDSKLETDFFVTALQGSDFAVLCEADDFAVTKRIIDAAVVVGVRRIILSEYTGDLSVDQLSDFPLWGDAYRSRRYAHEKATSSAGAFTWSSVTCGLILETALRDGLLGVHLPEKTLDIVDSGTHKFSSTSIKTVAKAVVASMTHLEQTANRAIFVNDLYASSKELKLIAFERCGMHFKESHTRSTERLSDGQQELKDGASTGYGEIVSSVYLGDHPEYRRFGDLDRQAREDMDAIGLQPDAEVVVRLLRGDA